MVTWDADQLAEIDAALASARAGAPALLVVEGAPGAGKSSLLRTMIERAAGFSSLVLESVERDRDPYSTVARAGLDVPPQASPLVAANSIRKHLDAIASHQPVLLAVDDAQWADQESVRAVMQLLEGAESDAMLVSMATHPLAPGAHEELQEYMIGSRARRIQLDGLSRDAAKQLAWVMQPGIDDDTIDRLWRLTNGNPLYFTSILQEHDAADLSSMDFLPAPEAFSVSVGRRLERLGPDPKALMRGLAVLGSSWQSVATVAAISGVTSPMAAVGTLIKSGLVTHRASTELSGSIRPVHELIRAAVYQRMEPTERRQLHMAAAALVDDADAALAHRVAAVDQFDDGLARDLDSAARRNHAVGAFRRSADQLRWSSGVSRDSQVRRDRYLDSLLERVFADDLAGLRDEVSSLGAQNGDRVALLGAALASQENRWRDAVDLLAPVTAKPLDGADLLLRYRSEVLAAYAGLGAGEPVDDIVTHLERAYATKLDDPALVGYQAFTEGHVRGRLAGTEGFRAYGAWLPEFAAEVPLDATYHLLIRGLSRVGDCDATGAVADLTEVERRFHRGVVNVADGVTHAYLGVAYWLLGDWQLAEVKFRTARSMQRRIPNPMPTAIGTLGLTSAGDFGGSAAVLSALRGRLLRQPWQEGILWLATATAVRLHAMGDLEAQSDALEKLEADFGVEALGSGPGYPLWLIYRIPLSIWAGRLDEAQSLIALLSERPDRLPWMESAGEWFRGLIAERRGQHGRARRHFDDALHGAISEVPLLRAHVLTDRARLDGDADALNDAVAAYRALGQVPYVERLSAGEKQDAPARPVVFESLSDRERDVVSPVSAGLSYAQIAQDLFISTSTVGFHLTKIYAKTGVSSRHELTALVRGGA